MIILQKRKKEEGIKDQNSGYTFGKIAELYLSDTKYKKRAINTDRYYRLILNNWILPELGDIKLRSIEESDLERLYDKIVTEIDCLKFFHLLGALQTVIFYKLYE